MRERTRETPPRFKARIAGIFYLASFVVGIFGERCLRGRLGFAVGLLAVACSAVMTLVLYDILKMVHRGLALLAASFNLVGLAFEAARWNPQSANIALVFHGFYCLLTGYLVFRSAFQPRILGALMALAGLAWLAFLSLPLANRLSPWNVASGLLGEASLMLWLLAMGVNARRWSARANV
ncbi:MAG: DUF4386 domain-containing protein [Terracidiphilus sp.]|jgi:hypothetical protein